MAGSYMHAVDDDGRLRNTEKMSIATENGGDSYETIEYMYGMIWFLADGLQFQTDHPAEAYVEEARQRWQEGLDRSPGREPEP